MFCGRHGATAPATPPVESVSDMITAADYVKTCANKAVEAGREGEAVPLYIHCLGT
jgi:hypothetical protein